MKKIVFVSLAIFALPSGATAQVVELPSYAYDMVAEVTLATSADTVCDGIRARPQKVNAYIVALYTKLAAEGISAPDAAAFLQTAPALAQLEQRDTDLRAKHGVSDPGPAGLCTAIRAEAKENKELAKLMRIR